MKLHSIFKSISGEIAAVPQGALTTFVRLSGCNLQCSYCDSVKTQTTDIGVDIPAHDVALKVHAAGLPHVLITGGEPLLQYQEVRVFMSVLHSLGGYTISIETNGTLICPADARTQYIVDYKLPGSGESGAFEARNTRILTPNDWLKFVCTDHIDYTYMLRFLRQNRETLRARFAAGAAPPLTYAQLTAWLLEDADLSNMVVNAQIHKWIWPQGEWEGVL